MIQQLKASRPKKIRTPGRRRSEGEVRIPIIEDDDEDEDDGWGQGLRQGLGLRNCSGHGTRGRRRGQAGKVEIGKAESRNQTGPRTTGLPDNRTRDCGTAGPLTPDGGGTGSVAGGLRFVSERIGWQGRFRRELMEICQYHAATPFRPFLFLAD